MLRITARREGRKKRVLYLEGKICQQWVGELQAEVERCLKEGEKVVLDFSRVGFLDEAAAEMINRLPARNVEKKNGSLFIRTMLKMEGQDGQ